MSPVSGRVPTSTGRHRSVFSFENQGLSALSIFTTGISTPFSAAGFGRELNQTRVASSCREISEEHPDLLVEVAGAVIKEVDHWLPVVLLDFGEEFHRVHGRPLFSSHMVDLSTDPLHENIDTVKRYLEHTSRLDMTLEFELGVTGGEEDGVDHSNIDATRLYTQPVDVAYAYGELIKVSDRFTIAASFGNVHGVYKPGNVSLEPKILRDSQAYVQEKFGTGENPICFVFHGGSGSTVEEIREAISYGVVKFNIDTDLQWALWDGVRQCYRERQGYMDSQLGNPEGADKPNKGYYDPRTWLRKGEESFKIRLVAAFEDLQNVNTLG